MSAIIGIPVSNRLEESIKLQTILSKYGCSITTRLGLHHKGEYKCHKDGIVIIEVVEKINEIYDELIQHWQIQIMRFE